MSTTNIHLPDTLPFPIKILSLPVKPPTNVKPGTRLVNYSYIYTTTASASASASSSTEQGVVSVSETRIGSWDAPFEGELHAWKVKPGDVVSRQQAKERPALVIVEPCRHEVQVNKLCALCGMDMEKCVFSIATFI
jgi:RNA polymerase II subunit A-like phosphatase